MLTQAQVRLAAELLQLHWMLSVTYTKFIAAVLTLVVSSLSLLSIYLPVNPKVGSRTPIIALETHGSYSRYFKASSLTWGYHCCRCPTFFRQSLRLVERLLQLHRTLTAVTLGTSKPIHSHGSITAITVQLSSGNKFGSRTCTIALDALGHLY